MSRYRIVTNDTRFRVQVRYRWWPWWLNLDGFVRIELLQAVRVGDCWTLKEAQNMIAWLREDDRKKRRPWTPISEPAREYTEDEILEARQLMRLDS